MAKENKSVKNFPNLRFPGFDGQWEEKNLGDICDINPKNENLPNTFIYIDLESVVDGSLQKENTVLKEEAPSRAQRILFKNDILFQMVRPYQKNNLFFDKDGDFVASTGYAQIRTKENSQFIFQYLHNQNFVDKVIERCTGTSYPAINSSDLGKIKIAIPKLEEQKKIGDFLNIISQRILSQKKIIEQLETLIKGGGYKLFNKKIRFKNTDLSEFPSWESKKGNEVFSNISNKSHNSELPILAITQEYGAIPRDLIDFKISVTDKSVESYKVVEKGDFIISLRSFQGGIEYSEYKGICSPAYIILRNKIEVNSYFYKYYFKSESYIKQLNKKLEGIRDGKMISYAYFSDINLPLPSVDEQTKIANFLSSIQEKIETEKQILEKLELQKKFLLANLFV